MRIKSGAVVRATKGYMKGRLAVVEKCAYNFRDPYARFIDVYFVEFVGGEKEMLAINEFAPIGVVEET